MSQAERKEPAPRAVSIGDTVQTTLSNGNVYKIKITTSLQCAYANELIQIGRWSPEPNWVEKLNEKPKESHE